MLGTALQTLLSLGLVLGLIFALAWASRRLQAFRGTQAASLQIESGLQLGPKEKLVLVKVYGQQFLLGVTPGGVNLVHRFPPLGANSAEVIAFDQHLKARP